ncbi:Synaptonemal complex protein 1 [Stylophora pistillata]|uniref:Synaptonemal complex protein 1 n=1 Tax=Stylophora pistillata TaxID=50429 RepID=A0A2B4ST03_STYPI|nr:Synaptonemal complex protein 1 [Stylophora pistillata]
MKRTSIIYFAICGFLIVGKCSFFSPYIGDVNEMQSHAHSQLKHHIQQPLFKLTTNSIPQSHTHQATASPSPCLSPNFNKSPYHGHLLNIRPMNSPSNSYFRPKSPRQKEKEAEKLEKDRTQSAERIHSLHTRLHQEADKIRKWKTSTEIEIKEKEKKLLEAVQTIDSQRKSILDLQFQNESLSSKLQEELANREEVEHKIVSTRDMCNVLKDHVAKVEENILKGEADRDELRFEDKKRIGQFQEMVIKFQDLQIEHTAKFNEMKEKMNERKKEHEDFVMEYTENLQKADNQIRLLETDKKTKENQISTMEAALEKSKEESTSFEHELALLQDKLKKFESIITSQQVQIQNTEDMLSFNKQECKRTEEERQAIQSQFESVQQENQILKECNLEMKKEQRKILDGLEIQLSSLIKEKEKLEEDLQNLTKTNETTTEELKHLRVKFEALRREKEKADALNDHILKEKNDLMKASADLQENLLKEAEKVSSKGDLLRQSKEKLGELQETNFSLMSELDRVNNVKHEIEEKIRKLTLSSEEKQRTISDLEGKFCNANYNEKYLTEKVQDLQKKLQDERKEKEQLQNCLEEFKDSERKLRDEISILEEKNSVLDKSLMEASKAGEESSKLIEKLDGDFQKLQKKYNKMMSDGKVQDEERATVLEKEKDNNRSLKDDLKEKTKQLEILETKAKGLQDQLTAKTKQSKELQQEKSKISAELDTSKEQIKDFSEKLEAMKKEIITKSETVEYLERQVRQFKEEKEKAIQDKETVQMESEKQMNELCATLEKYKLENEKIVAQKERELDLLLANAEKESQEKHEKLLMEAKKQIKKLERDICDLKENQEKDRERLEFEKSEAIEVLQKQLEAKSARSPRTPSSDVKLKTPKLPDHDVAEATPQDSAVVPETPKQPRGILKLNDVSQKKRRVAFTTSGEQTLSSEEEDEKHTKDGRTSPKLGKTPGNEKENQRNKPRSNVRFSPKPSSWNSEPLSTKSPFPETQLKQIPRGKPVVPQKQKKMKIQSDESEEIARFKELFPDIRSPDSLYDKSPMKSHGLHQGMKPPFKSKITKIKPLARKKKEKQETIAWFDSDALFGFGIDDE